MIRSENVAAAFVAVFVLAPFVWWGVDREPPYEIVSGKIEPHETSAGDEVEVVWHVRPLRSCKKEGTVVRTFVDVMKYKHTAEQAPAKYRSDQRDPSRIENYVIVPLMPDGPSSYSSRACYPCNPVQEIFPVCIETPSLPLTIKNRH